MEQSYLSAILSPFWLAYSLHWQLYQTCNVCHLRADGLRYDYLVTLGCSGGDVVHKVTTNIWSKSFAHRVNVTVSNIYAYLLYTWGNVLACWKLVHASWTSQLDTDMHVLLCTNVINMHVTKYTHIQTYRNITTVHLVLSKQEKTIFNIIFLLDSNTAEINEAYLFLLQ